MAFGLYALILACIAEPLLCAGLAEEVVRRIAGEAVTLAVRTPGHQVSSDVAWYYSLRDPKIMIAQLYRGIPDTNYSQRFTDRLQLDRQTGSLTISNLNTNDSGVYQLQVLRGGISLLQLELAVYYLVSKPLISPSETSLHSNSSCSVLCSVENGREVTLSWQREGETLNHTSSPDLNTPLSLPLEIEEYSSTYSCVAANPVSNKTVTVKPVALCQTFTAFCPWPWAFACLGLVLIAVGVTCNKLQAKNRKSDAEPVCDESVDMVYSLLGDHAHPRYKSCSNVQMIAGNENANGNRHVKELMT